MAATQTGRRPRWALPPQPPETWLSPVWSALLAAALTVAIAVPVVQIGVGSGPYVVELAIVHAVSSAAAIIAAHALLVEHSVRHDPWLRWASAGFACAYLLLLGRALTGFDVIGHALGYLALAAVPLYAITRTLATRPAHVLAVPAAVLAAAAGAAVVAETSLPDLVGGPVWAGVSVLSLGAFGAWRTIDRPRGWVWLCLLLTAAAAGAQILAVDMYDNAWWVAVAAETIAVAVPAAGIGIETAWGFGRQSRRWRQLETEVRALRTASPLLPGRSVTPDDDEGLPGRTELQVLIDAGLVRVAIQPVIELQTGAVVGHEALSRFGGRVPTDRWFKAASKYGMGGQLERVTLLAAVELLPNLPANEFLAVNISPAALADREVMRLLDGIDLSRIVVEITEHEAVADYRVTRTSLGALRREGARIAVDDTGAGFASLRHVLMLQPDVIKLDTSLTRQIEVDKRQQQLVRAVTVFSHQVGAVVLAEGIETPAQLDVLRHIGVPLGQGWHLGVPVLSE